MFNILELRAQGLSIREVARRTGHDRKTVRKWLRQREIPRYGPRPPVSGKLEPYKPYLQARIAVGVWNANRLLEELRAQAFQSVHQATPGPPCGLCSPGCRPSCRRVPSYCTLFSRLQWLSSES